MSIYRLAGGFRGISFALAAASAFAAEPEAREIVLPQRLMSGCEILDAVHRQTGLNYAYPSSSPVRQLDTTPFGGRAKLDAVVPLLAARTTVRDGAIELESDTTDSDLAKWERDLRGSDIGTRRHAAYLLGCSGRTAAVVPLLAALDDKDESVRHHVLRSLDRLERDLNEYCPPGRVSIFRSVAAKDVARLVSLLESAPDASASEWIWSAGLCGRARAAEARPALLKGSQHPYAGTRKAAEWALARLDDAAGIMSQPYSDPDAERSAVLSRFAMEKLPWQRADLLLKLGQVGGSPSWQVLVGELGNTDTVVRQSAIRGLRRCPDPQAVEPLMQLLTGEKADSQDRNLAAVSLGLIGSGEAVRSLTNYVATTDKPISTAALALGYTMNRGTVPALIKCARSDNDALKSYAFTALARLGTREAVDAVAGLTGQYDNVSRYQANAAIRLAGWWSQEAVNRFVEALRNGGRIAAHGLEMSEDPRAVDALLAELPKSREDRLQWILQSLGRIGDPRAVPELLRVAFEAESEDVKYQALRALRWRWYWTRPDVRAALETHPVFSAFVKPPPTIEEQEENTWVLRLWPVDLDDDRVCSTSYEAGLEFDESTGCIFKWGSHGVRCDSPQTGFTWLYDVARNTWRESKSPVNPFGMCGTWGTVYDRANRCIVSVQAEGANHGWQWDRARAMRVSSPWVYYGERDAWVPSQVHEPGYGPGLRGFHQLVYHDRTQLVFLYGGQGGNFNKGGETGRGWVYDAYANEWTFLPPSDPVPGGRAHHAICYFPTLDRVLMTGGSFGSSDKRTWMYDLQGNTWTDMQPKQSIPQLRLPLVYDPVTDTALHFGAGPNGVAIWQYDPAVNEWRKLPDAKGPMPHHDSVDVAYDPVRNVYIMDGGHLGWNTDHLGVREVWTYRFKRGAKLQPALPPTPQGVKCVTTPSGVELTWDAVDGAKGYLVYRAEGEAWRIRPERCFAQPLHATRFSEGGPEPRRVRYYCVTSISGDGRESPRSLIARTQPPLVRDVVVSTLADRTVRIAWSHADAPDVAGYHVYASTVKLGEMHPFRLYGKIRPLTRLTDKPVASPVFLDERPLAGEQGDFVHEVRAYEIRAVNTWGVESGPSATTLNVASSVPRVRAIERPDGATLVQWDASPEDGITGYRVYRMDDYRPSCVFLLNPAPVAGTEFADRPDAPKAERRKYYVVAVNALGQEGLPSSGAYSFGRP